MNCKPAFSNAKSIAQRRPLGYLGFVGVWEMVQSPLKAYSQSSTRSTPDLQPESHEDFLKLAQSKNWVLGGAMTDVKGVALGYRQMVNIVVYYSILLIIVYYRILSYILLYYRILQYVIVYLSILLMCLAGLHVFCPKPHTFSLKLKSFLAFTLPLELILQTLNGTFNEIDPRIFNICHVVPPCLWDSCRW